MSEEKSLWVTKVKLLALFGVFGLPLIAALIVARMTDHGLPDFVGTTNNGDLVEPPVELLDWSLQSPDGEMLDEAILSDVEEEWTLVYFNADGCDRICQDKIYSMRQLRLMLGRNALHVERLYVYGGLGQKEIDSVRNAFPDMVMATGEKKALERVGNQLKQPGHEGDDRLYLVDPVGQVMMSFPADMKPRLVYKDLKKLIKVTSTE